MSKIPRQAIVVVGAIAFLLPLSACNDDDLNRLLNGQAATATTQQRQPYGAVGTITEAEAQVVSGLIRPGSQPDASGFYRFAQPQSRRAITSRIGFENSYQGDSSYLHPR
jgi:hypothetical protein